MASPDQDDTIRQNRCYKRSLTLRYLFALTLAAAMALAAYGVFRHTLATIERAADITAVFASQRLLTQRVLSQCLLLSAADNDEHRRDIKGRLRQAVADLIANHGRLLADLDDPGSLAARSPDLRSVYFDPPYDLDRAMRLFIQNAHSFLDADTVRPSLSDPDFLNLLAYGENELLRDLSAVVRKYQGLALTRLALLGRLETGATAAMLVILAASGLLLFRPMVRRICADRQRLQEANETMARLAVTDQLTGAYNRLKFHEVMAGETHRASRYGEPLSVIMFDIDHFKAVNDTHGHGVGDDMLRELAHRVAWTIRDVDWLFRYGGEEFVVAVPHTDLTHAALMAEKIRGIVADTPFPHGICGSVSLGVAELRPGESVDGLMIRADAALYQAKDGGRNRVVVAENDPKIAAGPP